jgi:hypothetical protein
MSLQISLLLAYTIARKTARQWQRGHEHLAVYQHNVRPFYLQIAGRELMWMLMQVEILKSQLPVKLTGMN